MTSEVSIPDLFKAFNAAQQLRPAIYHDMQEAFDQRHEGCSHDYTDKSKLITARHVEASKAVIAVAVAFENNPETQLAGELVRSLQLLEKEKLQLTAELYMREQKFESERADHVGFEEAEHEVWVKTTKTRLRKVVEEINDVLDALKEEEVNYILQE